MNFDKNSVPPKLAQLNTAVEADDRDLVASLLAPGDIDLSAPVSSFGGTVLHTAVQSERREIAEMLLDAGAPINSCDSNCCYDMPVCALAVKNHDLLEMLIARGANLALGMPRKSSALSVAVNGRHEQAVVILLKAGAPLDPDNVLKAASISVRVIQALLDRGVDLKTLRDTGGGTVWHYVVFLRTPRDVLDLLINEVDVNAKDEYGNTCVHNRVEFGDDANLRFLVSAGADIDIANNKGVTPLLIAVHDNYANCVFSLLAAGADVHAKRNDGRTALQMALQPAFRSALAQEIVWALVLAGAPTDDCEDPRGQLSATDDQLDRVRRRIGAIQFTFVRHRALQICIGLQSLQLDALQMCEILLHACCPGRAFVSFHHWWAIATTVKHFRRLE